MVKFHPRRCLTLLNLAAHPYASPLERNTHCFSTDSNIVCFFVFAGPTSLVGCADNPLRLPRLLAQGCQAQGRTIAANLKYGTPAWICSYLSSFEHLPVCDMR